MFTFVPHKLRKVTMNATLSLDSILQLLQPMSTRNKQWLADRLYEAVKTEKEAKAAENEITPELMAKIERARYEHAHGMCKSFSTAEEACAWMDSL